MVEASQKDETIQRGGGDLEQAQKCQENCQARQNPILKSGEDEVSHKGKREGKKERASGKC